MAVTPTGRSNLGLFLEQIRKSAEMKAVIEPWLAANHPEQQVRDFVDRPQLALWLTAQADMGDAPVTEAALGRVERGEGRDGPPTKVSIAIIRAKILKLPDGTPYTHDDLVDVLTERLNPFTGQRQNGKNGAINGSKH